MKISPSRVSVLIGLVLLTYGLALVYERTRPIGVDTAPTRLNPAAFSVAFPTLNRTIPVFAASIENGKWQTTKQGISYLSSSPLPGTRGNSVMYGHNWPNILGNLEKLNPGDSVIIYRGTQTTRFTVYFKTVVEPTDSSVYAPTGDYRLTIYTCTGLLDTKRLVITAFADLPLTDTSR